MTHPLLAVMRPRDPHEPGRVASPLELFFDLVFVVAVAAAAAGLHHDLAEGNTNILHYAMAFFAIWWAWMNYTWFASAYAVDDVAYRLLTFVIMTGALVFAAGVGQIYDSSQSTVAVVGFAIMRLGMMAMWLRAARGDAERRRIAYRYAIGIALVQVLWIVRIWLPEGAWSWSFLVGVIAELSVPIIAERAGRNTPWHPHHIAERYALFTIIVLGEVILATVTSVRDALVIASVDGGAFVSLVVGGLLIVFSIWWIYFDREHHDLTRSMTPALVFGYGHVLVLASIAAVGAALSAAVDVATGHATAGTKTIAVALAIAFSVYLMSLTIIRFAASDATEKVLIRPLLICCLTLVPAMFVRDIGTAVAGIGVIVAVGTGVLSPFAATRAHLPKTSTKP